MMHVGPYLSNGSKLTGSYIPRLFHKIKAILVDFVRFETHDELTVIAATITGQLTSI